MRKKLSRLRDFGSEGTKREEGTIYIKKGSRKWKDDRQIGEKKKELIKSNH